MEAVETHVRIVLCIVCGTKEKLDTLVRSKVHHCVTWLTTRLSVKLCSKSDMQLSRKDNGPFDHLLIGSWAPCMHVRTYAHQPV